MEFNAVTKSKACHGQVASRALSTEEAVVSIATAIVRSVKTRDRARRAWPTTTPALKEQGFSGVGSLQGEAYITHMSSTQ
jgi:hypothetical protein